MKRARNKNIQQIKNGTTPSLKMIPVTTLTFKNMDDIFFKMQFYLSVLITVNIYSYMKLVPYNLYLASDLHTDLIGNRHPFISNCLWVNWHRLGKPCSAQCHPLPELMLIFFVNYTPRNIQWNANKNTNVSFKKHLKMSGKGQPICLWPTGIHWLLET